MQKVKLIVAYDGTSFAGWQDNGKVPSVEGELKSALSTLLQQDVRLEAASRTDAGVHAEGQVVVFDCPHEVCVERICKSLNHLLPHDISVKEVAFVKGEFHPSLDAKGKWYCYQICLNKFQLPTHRKFSWHIKDELDLEKMRMAARDFVGEHDFRAFCNSRSDLNYHSYVRKIDSVSLSEKEPGYLQIDIKGENFLYKMVRNIVGTLVSIGLGKLAANSVPRLILQKDRKATGITAPPNGLILKEVFYE